MSDMNDPKWRKARPVFSGVLKYFPDALREVAYCSYMGNEQHHPGEPLHWDRSKSTDEADACVRHLMESGTMDTDGVRHSAKAAWRALALLQKEIEADRRADAEPLPHPLEDTIKLFMKLTTPTQSGIPHHLTGKLGCYTTADGVDKAKLKYPDPDTMMHEDIEGDPNYWGV